MSDAVSMNNLDRYTAYFLQIGRKELTPAQERRLKKKKNRNRALANKLLQGGK